MRNKLKIAIVIPGHLRYWEDCRNNFLDNLYDTNHDIDVYVDTYLTVFRSDSRTYDEQNKKQFLTEEEIKKLFFGINVVKFNFDSNDMDKSQEHKIQSVYKLLLESNKKYDLVVRTRFDLLLDVELNYEQIYNKCSKNPKLIFIPKGGTDELLNDMLAVCLPDTFNIYADRFKYGDIETYEGLQHGSLKQISRHHNIEYDTNIKSFLKRVDGNIYEMGI
jgi:hypothetical protein